MLELGKSGTAGTGKGALPVLRDGAVVAVLRASNWKESATAVIGDRTWLFAKAHGELTARPADGPDDAVRLRARQKSFWSSAWAIELDGTAVELETTSFWKGTHRFVAGSRKIAESGSTGGWSPRPTLDAEASLSLDHQVFLLWLELVISRRNTATVIAATS